MSGKPSPRQERHAESRDRMEPSGRLDLLEGAGVVDDYPVVSIRLEARSDRPVVSDALAALDEKIRGVAAELGLRVQGRLR